MRHNVVTQFVLLWIVIVTLPRLVYTVSWSSGESTKLLRIVVRASDLVTRARRRPPA